MQGGFFFFQEKQMKNTVENTTNNWEFEQNYGKILAAIVVSAVRDIEAATGRKVLSLTVPKPAVWADPDKQPTINVRLYHKEKSPQPTKCSYHGSKGNWFYDWFAGKGKGGHHGSEN
jgi:hypothetical protein